MRRKEDNQFRWPIPEDVAFYNYEDIISLIDAPQIVGVCCKNKRKDLYAVKEDEWAEAAEFFCVLLFSIFFVL